MFSQTKESNSHYKQLTTITKTKIKTLECIIERCFGFITLLSYPPTVRYAKKNEDPTTKFRKHSSYQIKYQPSAKARDMPNHLQELITILESNLHIRSMGT